MSHSENPRDWESLRESEDAGVTPDPREGH